MSSSLFKAALGNTDVIGKLVEGFDWSKVNVKETSSEDFLHTRLAPSYGTLTKESVQYMDDELKIMIAGALRALSKLSPDARTWEAVMATMMQNTLLEPMQEGKVDRVDSLVKEGKNVFKFNGSADEAIVKEVETWFNKLISDEDVMQSTKIDINVLANIVAQTGATADAFVTFFYKQEKHEKTLIDIGILRFPDVSHPYFKVYRIQVTAWSQCKRIGPVQEDKNGIRGEFNARNFRPRKDIIAKLTPMAAAKGVMEAEHLFDD